MHMLFVATVPLSRTTADQTFQSWQGFAGYASNTIQPMSGVERLGENVWLLNMSIDPLPLCLLGSAARQHGIAFRLLPFPDEPQWIPAKTIAATTSHPSQP
jgi:hypothetical protein